MEVADVDDKVPSYPHWRFNSLRTAIMQVRCSECD